MRLYLHFHFVPEPAVNEDLDCYGQSEGEKREEFAAKGDNLSTNIG
jgi:hypothetical protein